MLGYSEEELSHLENWDKIPDDRASSAKRYAELQQGKRDRDEWAQHFVHRDGRDVFTSARFTLLRDAAGKPPYVASMAEDITERKKVEEERNRITQQMQLVLNFTGQVSTASICRATALSLIELPARWWVTRPKKSWAAICTTSCITIDQTASSGDLQFCQ